MSLRNGKLTGMTVRELIEELQSLPTDYLDRVVVHQSNYGDYSKTQQALPIRSIVGVGFITYSGYSNSEFAVVDIDEEENDAIAGCETMEEEHDDRLRFQTAMEEETSHQAVVILQMTEF